MGIENETEELISFRSAGKSKRVFTVEQRAAASARMSAARAQRTVKSLI